MSKLSRMFTKVVNHGEFRRGASHMIVGTLVAIVASSFFDENDEVE
ncbi:MAG: hypothetical protein HYV07_31455 [Deltaproteobacteria bacterium]|nr:hypothetical protein [Deltaproteobacteria bacterium]